MHPLHFHNWLLPQQNVYYISQFLIKKCIRFLVQRDIFYKQQLQSFVLRVLI